MLFRSTPEAIYKTFCSIGGKNGWFGYEILWRIRGILDKIVGGYGISRGRRDENDLRIGDSVDFWKVVDLKENERLLLYAQMKLPGIAWLEYKIVNNPSSATSYQLYIQAKASKALGVVVPPNPAP